MNDSLKNWAAGFIDGEGSFIIETKRFKDGRKRNEYLRPKLAVHVRRDDENALVLLRKAIGDNGYLYQREQRKSSTYGSVSKPTSECTWHTMEGTLKVVRMLDKHPLRAKKRNDYAIWRSAVLITQIQALPHKPDRPK